VLSAENIMATVFWNEKLLFLWTSCLLENSELELLYWSTAKSECSPLFSLSCKEKNIRSVLLLHDNTTSPLRSWMKLLHPPYSPDLAKAWSFEIQPVRTPFTRMMRYCTINALYQWLQSKYTNMNTCSCWKNTWQRWAQCWRTTVLSAMSYWSSAVVTHVWLVHSMKYKRGGITFWIILIPDMTWHAWWK
jgi:hypothetical protein